MYYVDLNIGQDLFNMLKFISTLPVNTTSDNSTLFQPAISVVMHPAVGGFPSAWEFTLIIVVALLAISFLASGNFFECYLFISRDLYKRQTSNPQRLSLFLVSLFVYIFLSSLFYFFLYIIYNNDYLSISWYALASLAH